VSLNIDTVEDLLPSRDMTRLVFTNGGTWVAENPGGPSGHAVGDIYGAANEGAPLGWLGQPPAHVTPVPGVGENEDSQLIGPAGASPDLSTVYFTYHGTLLAEDAPRTPYVAGNNDFGMYEWHGGALNSAGVLPTGAIDPFGAVPAGGGQERAHNANPEELDGTVSEDGSRAFFVSPDPRSPHPVGDPPQLYVRRTMPDGSHNTALVSRSELLPKVGGLPAPAPTGPVPFKIPVPSQGGGAESYVFASPDGSQAFFATTDQLTSAAPNDATEKVYDFDLNRGLLTYVPGVTMPIVVSSSDGSRLLFANAATSPATLELLSTGAGGETITQIAELPPPTPTETNNGGQLYLSPARATPNGSVFAFEADSPIPGFNNGGGFEQVYRYNSGLNSLACVSCPPLAISPSGDSHLSHDATVAGARGFLPTRGIAADGSRVFFDTPDPLVPRDVNGKRDVYEWENGSVYLISAGQGARDSFLIDNSATGADVFFATADGLAEGDTDGSYDVYDARVGYEPASQHSETCVSECQGPPSSPPVFTAPVSATFAGDGNVATVTSPATTHKTKKKAKRKRRRKKKRKTSAGAKHSRRRRT
jgi:hypothetical protein